MTFLLRKIGLEPCNYGTEYGLTLHFSDEKGNRCSRAIRIPIGQDFDTVIGGLEDYLEYFRLWKTKRELVVKGNES